MKSKLVALMIASGALVMSGAALAGDAAAGEKRRKCAWTAMNRQRTSPA